MTNVDLMRASGVLWRGYADAIRRMAPLATPGALVHAPLAGLVLLLLVLWAGPAAAVVNGRLDLIGASDADLRTWALLLGALLTLAQAVALPATVLVAAGLLVGRRVPPVTALRAAARRLPATLPLFLAYGVAGYGVVAAAEAPWQVTASVVALALAAMPALLAVPAVVLHGCSAPAAVVRAYRLVRYRGVPSAWTLALGVVVLPVLAAEAARRGPALLPGGTATAGWAVAGTALVLTVTPFQAAVMARLFLHCMAWRTEVSDRDLEHGVPSGATGRPGGRRLWPAVLAPGLLFAGIVLVNPFRWTELTATMVSEEAAPVPVAAGDGQVTPVSRMRLRPGDLHSAHTGRDGGLILVTDGYDDLPSVLTCADPACARAARAWPDDVAVTYAELGNGTAAARLPDGRLAVSVWSGRRLRVALCRDGGCVPPPGPAVVAEARDQARYAGVAMAARRDGGLVVAFADRERPDDGDDLLSFVLCADPGCSRPEPRQVARLTPASYLASAPVLALASGPGDRPVAARFDVRTGQIHVVSCADPDCRRPRVTRPVPPYPAGDDVGPDEGTGLALAVRDDGRPVIAYRDARDRAVKLVDCLTPDCARADVVTVAAGSPYLAVPALVLDRAGRPLVAFQDRDGTRIMLAVCARGRCASTAVARGGDRLAMTLDGAGRPVIAWLDHNPEPGVDWDLFTVTALNLPG